MATIAGSFSSYARGVIKASWGPFTATTASDVGNALDAPNFPDKTVQIKGTVAGTIVIEGSNDGGTTYHTLNDSRGEGNALSFTTPDTRTILENPQLIRPRRSTSTGTPSATVIIVAQSTRR